MIPSIITLPLLQLASGDRLSLQFYQFKGEAPGKTVYLQANLHGAEIAGNAVIHELIEWLTQLQPSQLSGEIGLVPVCNPFSTNYRSHFFAGSRYNPYNGKDWNRIFWDYEQEPNDLMAFATSHCNSDTDTIQRAYRQQIQTRFTELLESQHTESSIPFTEHFRNRLQSLCLNADYVVDLHTSAGYGTDYVYHFHRRETSARLFLLPVGLLLDRYDGAAFDEAFIKPWLALEECFAQLNRPLQFDIEAYTLELGSAMQLNPESVANGVRGVKNYLIQKGVVHDPTFATIAAPDSPTRLAARSDVTKYYAIAGGMLQSIVPLGSKVDVGQRLYQILSFNKEGKLPTLIDVHAEQAGIVFDVTIPQAVNQGEYVLGILQA